jgi:ketosteroid isomerase-like protein
MNSKPMHEAIGTFFASVGKGHLPDTLISDSFSAWTLSSGNADKQRFLGGIAMLAKVVEGEFEYIVKSIIAEGNRGVAEVSSDWALINGERARNHHVFVFTFDDGKISHVSEYMDTYVPRETLGPLIQSLLADKGK